jgi:glycosyltransferase involved in cell wall biosynthesis
VKILIISPTQSGIGGIAKQVQGLLKFLLINNVEIDVVSSENTFTVPIRGFKNLSFMFSSFIKTKFITKHYDIIHAHNPVSAIAMKNINGKKILTLWGSYTEQVKLLHGNIVGKLSEKLEDESLKTADVITTSSNMIVKYCLKLGYTAHFIPDAIDFNELPKNLDRKYKKQIIYVGRLSKEKGILQLLEVCKKLPSDIHLLILGTGPEEKKNKAIIQYESKYSLFRISTKRKNNSIDKRFRYSYTTLSDGGWNKYNCTRSNGLQYFNFSNFIRRSERCTSTYGYGILC